ncbi:ribose 5-phosphate isomerase B [Streptobacillus moniliformis]|uniref:ribose 5-phosphate isomerase B n=1 Tax=Streptobacillus moniliformis TaxID=34105 RepID=UPI0007E3128B|nr:ribose 5-phosphate isomerase B [Streptobacillus moniliformis]AVL42594.1 ribose 5-phosphate isomerase B [Streptobacillus moniliformis]QXW65816.1 ribose 5-phosphate isomerase B [Streptobacillus moniliformis]SQA13823.1 Ribose-5-phosphate isomerase B [Streptobacillus moniliformis]
MKIAIGNDHSGVDFKNQLVDYLLSKGIEVLNVGTDSADSVDYPDIAKEVSKNVLNKNVDFGILICGTGIGISIAANRISGIRAALVTNELCARLSRQHNDANVLVLGARVTGIELAKSCIDAFLSADFEGGRHSGRVSKIECNCGSGVID